MKNLKIETPKYNPETLQLMSTLYVNEAEDPPLSGAVPELFAKVLSQIQLLTRATFKHKRESEIATGESVVLVRFNVVGYIRSLALAFVRSAKGMNVLVPSPSNFHS